MSIAGRYEGTACAYLSLATRARNLLSLASISRSPLSLALSLPACPILRDGTPPWRQHRGKWVIYLVSSHTNANSKRCHLWEIDLRFALNSTPGLWGADAGGYPRERERLKVRVYAKESERECVRERARVSESERERERGRGYRAAPTPSRTSPCSPGKVFRMKCLGLRVEGLGVRV